MTVSYGQGTPANGGCDECWTVPSRMCCMWDWPELNGGDAGAPSPSQDEPGSPDPNPFPRISLWRKPQ